MNRCLLICLLVHVSFSGVFSDNYHPIRTKRAEPETQLGLQEQESSFWIEKAQNSLEEKLAQTRNVNIAKNVILFLGDGMSIPTLTAARVYRSELNGGKISDGESLFFEKFPYTGLSKTYCVDLKVADSACSATAYLGGVKGNEGTIGVNAKVAKGDCDAMRNSSNHVDSIAHWFQLEGRSAGIVTTTRVTHASPAGAYANTANRDWESDTNVASDNQDTDLCDDIAKQLVFNEPGKSLKVILGGGRSGFLPKDLNGNRLDGENLIDHWTNLDNSTRVYASTRAELMNIIQPPDYLLGLFSDSHLDYHLNKSDDQPTLEEMTQKAIEVLKKNPKGFFLFVEGGKIDLAHHDNQAHIALDETIEFAKAIEKAFSMTNETETLIVVTADHAHTMSYSGYPERASTIFGVGGQGSDNRPYSILSYANGPGYKNPVDNNRPNLNGDDMTNQNYKFPTGAPLGSETHGGDDVAVFATGPWSHLFTGTYEENYLPHAMAYAACVGSGITACE